MKALFRYFNNLDSRAVRAISVSLVLLSLVALIFVMGRTTAFFDEDDAPLINWMQANAESPWALPAAIVVFTLAAFIGAPQFVLIAAAVVAFGPTRGFLYSWLATMVSAAFDFELARRFGADLVNRYAGSAANRISSFVGRNGFMTALLVRIVPSAPFIVVNMAIGMSRASRLPFLFGTGLGIIPKTALIAFAGQGVVELATGGDWRLALGLALGAAAWLAVMLIARHFLRERESRSD